MKTQGTAILNKPQYADPCLLTGYTLFGFHDQPLKERTRGGADVIAAFRMPLHADQKLGAERGIILHGFDDAVIRAARDDPQTFARDGNRLVMAGIHGETPIAIRLGCFGGFEQRGHAPIRGHRPPARGVANRYDHASATLDHRPADVDAVAGKLGRREPARGVAAPLADQAAGGAERGGPCGHVRGLPAGAEPDRRRSVAVGRERGVGQNDDVEDQIADRADRRRLVSVDGGLLECHADMITVRCAGEVRRAQRRRLRQGRRCAR